MALRSETFLGKIEELSGVAPSLDPQLVLASTRSSTSGEELLGALKRRFPRAQLHISTSCQGIMTERALSLEKDAVAVMVYEDIDSAFGCAGASVDETSHVESVTTLLIRTAELRAGRAGELPALVWISATPGSEERVIGSIKAYYKSRVLICGGSPADDEILGRWWVGDQNQIYPQGIVISLMYTTAQVITQFSAGYQLADRRGVVTRGRGRRIVEIDHRPAAEVYNEWCRGTLSPYFPDQNILAASAFQPLAVPCGALALTPYHRVIHPEAIHRDGSLSTFSRVESGDEIVLLSGEPESLVLRAGRVASCALLETGGNLSGVRAALVIFCAGCLLAIKERASEILTELKRELPDVPILGQFTFGEQGVFPDGEVAHGNLMVAVVLWYEAPQVDPWVIDAPKTFKGLDEQRQALGLQVGLRASTSHTLSKIESGQIRTMQPKVLNQNMHAPSPSGLQPMQDGDTLKIPKSSLPFELGRGGGEEES
ncbi:MAG: FIST N-terminal domain-containing protein [Myxococcota bacterium]|nr:FIST N-terminal domain-containing protein [Myxococcota bacterium]